MGGVRTALYNYLFARKHQGAFLLRLEDTDQTRFVTGAEEYIVDALNWCGIEIDEGVSAGGPHGPYRQSERKAMYRQYADQLVTDGYAYYAFDTSEELEQTREHAKKAGVPSWQYNNITRSSMKNALSLSSEEVKKRLDNGDPYVIRIKMPRNEEVKFEDRIRGWVSVNTNNLDDKVIFKSDGMPTYHLANVVDDHLMEITHVIRGEEWLPSAPLHVLLYRYLGWERPEFAHLPLILKPDGNGKLSKRDGDRLGFPVFPTNWKNQETGEVFSGYRENGYFPETFVNMLALLGWNPGTEQELFSMTELIDAFSLDRVGKSGARFDPEKTKWFNQQYLRGKSNIELVQMVQPILQENEILVEDEKVAHIVGLMKERATFPSDLVSEGMYFFKRPETYPEKVLKKQWKDEQKSYLQEIRDRFEGTSDWSAATLEASFKSYLEEKQIGFGKLAPVFRMSISGAAAGPGLFDICEILGKEETITRIDQAFEKLD
jgi:glutamyl-tRNA synthetase